MLSPDFKNAADIKNETVTTVTVSKAVFVNATGAGAPAGSTDDGLSKFAALHEFVMLNAQALQSSMMYFLQKKKFVALGADLQAASKKDMTQGNVLLMTLNNARDKWLSGNKAMKDCLAQKVMPAKESLVKVLGGEAAQLVEPLESMIALELSRSLCIQDDEVFVDATSHALVLFTHDINRIADEAKALPCSYEAGGDNSWKKDLPTDPEAVKRVTFAQLLDASRSAVEKLDGKKMRDVCDQFHKATEFMMEN